MQPNSRPTESSLHDSKETMHLIAKVLYMTKRSSVLCNGCYCLPCMAITACENKSLLHTSILTFLFSQDHSEVHLAFSFTALN